MLVTRQGLANRQISSRVAFLSRMDSRRASRATSRPTCARNLKQSATVFAAEKMRTRTPSNVCASCPRRRMQAFRRSRRAHVDFEAGRGSVGRSYSTSAVSTSCLSYPHFGNSPTQIPDEPRFILVHGVHYLTSRRCDYNVPTDKEKTKNACFSGENR